VPVVVGSENNKNGVHMFDVRQRIKSFHTNDIKVVNTNIILSLRRKDGQGGQAIQNLKRRYLRYGVRFPESWKDSAV
jgi:hypothetical protein